MVSEDEIKQIFNDFDGSGNGFLSVEEFARAIYQAVLADQDEYSEDELEKPD
jgi:Ca2+-binding EF-hand superfamily protein